LRGARYRHSQRGLLYPPLAPGKSGLAKKSFALIDHLRSVDKRRVRSVFGELAPEEIAAIDEGLAVFLGLGERLNDSARRSLQ
jgi:mRNA interferase MazF